MPRLSDATHAHAHTTHTPRATTSWFLEGAEREGGEGGAGAEARERGGGDERMSQEHERRLLCISPLRRAICR